MLPRRRMFKHSNSQGYQAARQDSSSGESEGEEETFFDVDEQDPPEEEPPGLDSADAIPSAIEAEMTAVHPTPVTEVETSPTLTEPAEQAPSSSLQDETIVTSMDGSSGSPSDEIPMQTFMASAAQPPVSDVTTDPQKEANDAPPPPYESLLFDSGAPSSGGLPEADKDAAEAKDALQADVSPSPTDATPPLELSIISEASPGIDAQSNSVELTIPLEEGEEGYGFRIVGGSEEGTQVTVSEILAGGPAEQDGRLRCGDQIIYVDGQSVFNASHQQVVTLIKNSRDIGRVSITVRQKLPSVQSGDEAATHSLLTVPYEGDIDVENAQNEGIEATIGVDSSTSHEITFRRIRRPGVKTALVVLINTVIALFILLMILSIQKLDYFQLGLKMKRVSKYVFFMEEAFDGGRYFLGPSNVFKQYSSVAHTVDFPEVRIYTTDPLRISFHCHFHFFIKKTELGLLEDELDRYYLETVEKASISAIKNTASMYSIDQFLEMRPQIERHVHQRLQTELQGTCCLTREQCHDFPSCHDCYANATTDCVKGYHLEVPFFNLLTVDLPESVLARKQAVLITALGGEEEVFHQEAAITRIETERMVQELLNQAAFISSNATAHAAMIRAKAKAEARAITNRANSMGLTTLYSNLSVVEQDHKASIHWLRTLRNHQNLITGVDFEDYKRLMQERGG